MQQQQATAPITERINTWEDILSANNRTQEDFDKEWSGKPDYEIAEEQKRLMALALNEGEVMDVSNTSQRKYFPLFDVIKDSSRPSGFRLSCLDYDCTNSYAFIGARHALKSPELTRHAATRFAEFYERAMV